MAGEKKRSEIHREVCVVQFDVTEGIYDEAQRGFHTRPAVLELSAGAKGIYLDIEGADGLVQIALSPDKVFGLIRSLNDLHLEHYQQAALLEKAMRSADL